jgi:hypothetical protein
MSVNVTPHASAKSKNKLRLVRKTARANGLPSSTLAKSPAQNVLGWLANVMLMSAK